MKKLVPYQLIIPLLALLLIIGSMLWTTYTINRESVQDVTNISNETFGKEHYNTIYTDTFIALLHRAYGTNISVIPQAGKLNITLSGAGAVTKDFYNGNDKILDFNTKDFGFEIRYNPQEKSINATFLVADGAVSVPNDVMIKLLDKTYNK